LRKEPSHRAEQVSQLIFGETATIEKKEGEWLFVKMDFDGYVGWLEEKNVADFRNEAFEIINFHSVLLQTTYFGGLFLPVGAQVCFNPKKQMVFNEHTFDIKSDEFPETPDIAKLIMEFLGAPYLWGGRTPYGVDCSGFTQIIMKCMNIKLPRDASQQALCGKDVADILKARQGDLAFFANEDNSIVHVGIVLKNKNIVHSSGYVRIDKLDDKGIFNESTGRYTHQLSHIKTLR
jgi:hypothetical protein